MTSKIVHPKPDNFIRCWCKEHVLYRGRAKVVDGKIHSQTSVCRKVE